MTITCFLCDRDVVIIDYADKIKLLRAMTDEHKRPVCQECHNEYVVERCFLDTMDKLGHTGSRWAN
jgi:hypothetical protein